VVLATFLTTFLTTFLAFAIREHNYTENTEIVQPYRLLSSYSQFGKNINSISW